MYEIIKIEIVSTLQLLLTCSICTAGFMRKVYSLLSIQLAITTLIGATLLLTPGVKEMVQVMETTFLAFLFSVC